MITFQGPCVKLRVRVPGTKKTKKKNTFHFSPSTEVCGYSPKSQAYVRKQWLHPMAPERSPFSWGKRPLSQQIGCVSKMTISLPKKSTKNSRRCKNLPKMVGSKQQRVLLKFGGPILFQTHPNLIPSSPWIWSGSMRCWTEWFKSIECVQHSAFQAPESASLQPKPAPKIDKRSVSFSWSLPKKNKNGWWLTC